MVLEAGVQFVKEKVVTLVTEKAGTPSNVAPPTAGPSVLSYVPVQSPSVAAVAAVPVALSKSLAPLAAEAFMLVPTGNESVDTTGSVCVKPTVPPPPPPPPPHPASTTSNRQYEFFIFPPFRNRQTDLSSRAPPLTSDTSRNLFVENYDNGMGSSVRCRTNSARG